MHYKEEKKESLAMVLLAAALTAVATGLGNLLVEEIKEWREKKKKREEELTKKSKKIK